MTIDRSLIALSGTDDLFRAAIESGGGIVTAPERESRALIWTSSHDSDGLRQTIRRTPSLRWVQLPSAGVDDYREAGLLDPAITWTSAKGAFARPVAEHALALCLALLRRLPDRVRATSWGHPDGVSLYGSRVLVVGGGGIAAEFARLVEPFDVELTVCRRRPLPVSWAERTVAVDALADEIGTAHVVVIAAPLTSETRGIIDKQVLASMRADAILVNVARGAIVVTDDLVHALRGGVIAGAALDVTDPEPLPDGHALWSEPRVLLTPHTADTAEMIRPLQAERISVNVRRFLADEELIGVVDPTAGY